MLTASLLATLVVVHVAAALWWRGAGTGHDRLTGLPTRQHLIDEITRCATRAVWRPGYRFAVLVLEIDPENALPGSVGRFGLQDAIADTAERLALCIRGGDVVTRIADRRFGILLDDVSDADGAHTASRRLMTALEETSTLGGRRVRTTTVAGLAFSGERDAAPETLLAQAEAALDAAPLPAKHEPAQDGLLGREPVALRQLQPQPDRSRQQVRRAEHDRSR
jgi:diguanylate cyclase